MLRSAGFSPFYLEHNPSKAYFLICKVLTGLGLHLGSCFLKQGKSKYVYISLHAALYLFETAFGPFKDKEKAAAFRREILEALAKHGLGAADAAFQCGGPKSGSPSKAAAESRQKTLRLPCSNDCPPLRYLRISD